MIKANSRQIVPVLDSITSPSLLSAVSGQTGGHTRIVTRCGTDWEDQLADVLVEVVLKGPKAACTVAQGRLSLRRGVDRVRVDATEAHADKLDYPEYLCFITFLFLSGAY